MGLMLVLQYPAVLERDDNATWLVTFPDFDDAVTFGETREEALDHAVDALETVIVSRMQHKLGIPAPSSARGKALVTISPLIAAKALLYKELRDQNVSIRQLAQRMDCEYPVAHRLLDVKRKTQVNEIARAFQALGKRVIIGVEKVR
jgi:predicted RNase H-like HicB family nuclease